MTSAIIFSLIFVAAFSIVFWDLIVFAAEPYLDAATRRTTTLRERSARAWADFKLGVVQKAAAGARLVKLMGALVVLSPFVGVGFVVMCAGYLCGPLLNVLTNWAGCFQMGYESSGDATELFFRRCSRLIGQ